MDKAQVLANVKVLQGIADSSKDALVNLLIDKSEADIKAFCSDEFLDDAGADAFPANLVSVLEDLVIYRYNNRGSEGIASKSLGSFSVSYNSEFPSFIATRLYPYRKMRVW